MNLVPLFVMCAGALATLGLLAFAFAGPSPERAAARRLGGLRARVSSMPAATTEDKVRRITGKADTRMDTAFGRFLPNVALLKKRLAMTGQTWNVGQYGAASVALLVVIAFLLWLKGAPLLLALFVGLFVGAGLPHFVVGFCIKRRIAKFTARFPDAIELLVRGLRSGLPISETLGIVGNELVGPVGVEFRLITDRMKIGRTMDAALQETADRIGTPEFQFFVITIAIQRETGGNLAETLANLATVLRMRGQMKLKIKAMSSESKASAYIIGSLPFVVFGMIWAISGDYMQKFFVEPRLIIAGIGGLIWMSIGGFIMAKMINFEI